ncbi:MAG: hypothetical protein LBF00_02560 [Mycoplasmataceae bacterium]|jgi:hypothetical protein|nr:hypothetical protein [Mycoplasmataceae bacterium]
MIPIDEKLEQERSYDKIKKIRTKNILKSRWAKRHFIVCWVIFIIFVTIGLILFFEGIGYSKEPPSPFSNPFGYIGMIFWGIGLATPVIYNIIILVVVQRHVTQSLKTKKMDVD